MFLNFIQNQTGRLCFSVWLWLAKLAGFVVVGLRWEQDVESLEWDGYPKKVRSCSYPAGLHTQLVQSSQKDQSPYSTQRCPQSHTFTLTHTPDFSPNPSHLCPGQWPNQIIWWFIWRSGAVAYTCNSSYAGGRYGEDHSLGSAQAKVSETLSQNQLGIVTNT
jgi:hypothetical protein